MRATLAPTRSGSPPAGSLRSTPLTRSGRRGRLVEARCLLRPATNVATDTAAGPDLGQFRLGGCGSALGLGEERLERQDVLLDLAIHYSRELTTIGTGAQRIEVRKLVVPPDAPRLPNPARP